MTLLVTGFDPFAGAAINASWEAVQRLAGLTVAGHAVVVEQIPTVFGKAIPAMTAAIAHHQPLVILAVGQAVGRAAISVERVAINLDDARIPDNHGNQPQETPVVLEGPTAYFSTLPVKPIVRRLGEAGIPAEVSQTAGTFVCNHLFYGLMHHLAGREKLLAGFIHIPALPEQVLHRPEKPSMALEQVVTGLALALEITLLEP